MSLLAYNSTTWSLRAFCVILVSVTVRLMILKIILTVEPFNLRS